MRLAIAGFHLESACFLPAVSTLEDFERVAQRGSEILTAYAGTNTVPGGFIEICRANSIDMVPIVYSYLGALGPTEDRAIEAFSTEIAAGIRDAGDIDGVLLHLHGAAWAPGYPDPERHFLAEARAAVGPDLPIIVAPDYHGNIDAQTLEAATAAFAYQKSPHTDMGETGRRAARCMCAVLTGELSPAVAVTRPNVVVPSIFSATGLKPLAGILAEARSMEANASGYLDISVMAGFSYADAPNTGFSVVAVSGDGQQAAQAAADQLSQCIWADRAALYRPERIYSVDEAVNRAMAQTHVFDQPIVLLEHADRLNDSTYLLAELVARDAQNVGIPFLWDSEAALAAHAAGSGAQLRLEIGGLSSDKAGPRRAYDCEVLQSGAKTYRISGQMLQGQMVDLGMTALVRIGGITVSLVSNFAFGVDEDAFRVFGQDPRSFDIIVLRSKTHFRQVYEELSAEILIVDTPDYGPADVTLIPYEKLDTSKVYPFCAG